MTSLSDSEHSGEYDSTDEDSHMDLTAEKFGADSDDYSSLILLIPCAP